VAALVKEKTLFRAATGVYEFRRSEAADFETMIEEYKTDPDNQPADLAQEVVELVPLGKGEQWLEAKNYNLPYDEDKRLLRVFVRPGDLEAQIPHDGEMVDFFTYQEGQMQAMRDWKDRYEGVAVYVLCETDEEVQRARRLAEGNQSRYVIIGIPHQPIPIRDAVMNLRAVLHIQKTEDLDAMSLQDRSRLQQDLIGDEQKGYKGGFIKARRQYLAGKALTWYAAGGRVLVSQPSSEYEPADELMRDLFSQRNAFPHPYLNPIHVTRFGPGKDVILSDAIETLLRTHRPVEIDHNAAANRGEIRFLKKCLADNGALVQLGPYRGSVAEYQVEANPGKFCEKLPALGAMMDRLRGLGQGERVPVRELIETYARDPLPGLRRPRFWRRTAPATPARSRRLGDRPERRPDLRVGPRTAPQRGPGAADHQRTRARSLPACTTSLPQSPAQWANSTQSARLSPPSATGGPDCPTWLAWPTFTSPIPTPQPAPW
jgi:hypothetical protein